MSRLKKFPHVSDNSIGKLPGGPRNKARFFPRCRMAYSFSTANGGSRCSTTRFKNCLALMKNPLGAPLLEEVREASLDELITRTFRNREPTHGEIMLADRHWHVSAEPMQHGNGAKAGTVVLFHDITALKQADEMRRDFVANVSHELRTPLSIFRGYIETMLDDPKMPRGETARILEVMDQHSKRLGLLANDLLTLAQMESGSSSLQTSEIDLVTISFRPGPRLEKENFGQGTGGCCRRLGRLFDHLRG